MAKAKDYQQLFATLQRIVEGEPDKVPQLLAVILAGGPFRPYLDKPELLAKVVAMARQYVAEKKKKKAAPRPAPIANGGGTVTQPRGGRR